MLLLHIWSFIVGIGAYIVDAASLPEGHVAIDKPSEVLAHSSSDTISSTSSRTTNIVPPTVSASITMTTSNLIEVTSRASSGTNETTKAFLSTISSSITYLPNEVNEVSLSIGEQPVAERIFDRNTLVPSDVDKLSTASQIGIGLGALCIFVIIGIVGVYVCYKRMRTSPKDSDKKSQSGYEDTTLDSTLDISGAAASYNDERNSRSLPTAADDDCVYAIPNKRRRKDGITKDDDRDGTRINGMITGFDMIINNERIERESTRHYDVTTLYRVYQSTDANDYGYNVASINPHTRMDISNDYDKLN
ncbi:uncharacterized protein LOC127841628 [Dreissena polymorpha]|uniref:Mid2 domain-containing protein n=1 Tax=Dreissena polymorpha TaxID=45954 RepID=A0A9D4IYU3_DREPO|nr:uncharacterized protein LOC127841628 [Dreissena polymorpha]KAH3789303.1 hypothetical protein DPMN_167478 [Dreissena polymorpha]